MGSRLPSALLGRTGERVARLGYGAMELRGPQIWGGRPVDKAVAAKVLNTALDGGINFIDTSNDYGLSEELIGQTISHRRNELFLASKCGCLVEQRPEGHCATRHLWTPANLRHGIEESLRRLRTDYVDLMQLHGAPFKVCEAAGLINTLLKLQQEGKLRYIGCSTAFPHVVDYLSAGTVDTIQVPYSALAREHEECLSLAARRGTGTIVRSSTRSGSYIHTASAAFARAGLDEFRASGETRMAFLLRFALSHPAAHTVIVGSLDAEHMSENIRAAERGPLPPEILLAARYRLEQVGIRPWNPHHRHKGRVLRRRIHNRLVRSLPWARR